MMYSGLRKESSDSDKIIEFQMQDDEPSLQKVRMTQATFLHSTLLQRQSRRGSTVIEKLSHLFKIMKLSPSCLLPTRSGWVGCLWSCRIKAYRGRSPVRANTCRNSCHEGTVLNRECCRHLVGAQCCLWTCPRPKLSILAVCPGDAVLLPPRNTGTSADMPNWAWEHILIPSTWLQLAFSLSEALVTNLKGFTWSSFPKWSSPSQSVKLGVDRRSCHCPSAVGHHPAQALQGRPGVCRWVILLNFALKKLEVLRAGASSWMDGLSGWQGGVFSVTGPVSCSTPVPTLLWRHPSLALHARVWVRKLIWAGEF